MPLFSVVTRTPISSDSLYLAGSQGTRNWLIHEPCAVLLDGWLLMYPLRDSFEWSRVRIRRPPDLCRSVYCTSERRPDFPRTVLSVVGRDTSPSISSGSLYPSGSPGRGWMDHEACVVFLSGCLLMYLSDFCASLSWTFGSALPPPSEPWVFGFDVNFPRIQEFRLPVLSPLPVACHLPVPLLRVSSGFRFLPAPVHLRLFVPPS